MRIMILVRSLELAGAEKQATLLASGLRRRGHDVHVVLLKEANDLAPPLRASGVEITSLGSNGAAGAARSVLRLMVVLRRWRPDAVYGFMDAPNVLVSTVAHVARGSRLVAGIRATDLDRADMPWIARFLRRIEPLATRGADVVVVNSLAGAAFAADRGFRSRTLMVIDNGVDTAFFDSVRDEGRALRSELGLPRDVPLLGRIGRLHPMKGWSDFLDAVKACQEAGHEFRVLAVGSGPQATEFDERATALGIEGIVHWLSAMSDIRRVYSAIDVLVSSSIYGEGMPNVVMEAMACRVPCVVTDVGDSARVVSDTGLVVPPRRPDLLAAAIGRLLEAPDRRMLGERARHRIVEEFGLDRMIDRSAAVLFGSDA